MWWVAIAWAADVPTLEAQRARLEALAPDRDAVLAAVLAGPDGRFPATHAFTAPHNGVTLDEALSCAVQTWEPPTLACTLGFSGAWSGPTIDGVHVDGQHLVFDPMLDRARGALTVQDDILEKSRLLMEIVRNTGVETLRLDEGFGDGVEQALGGTSGAVGLLHEEGGQAATAGDISGAGGGAGGAGGVRQLMQTEVSGSGTVEPQQHTEIVASVMRRNSGQLKYCYELTLRVLPSHEGTYGVVATIEGGRVVGAPQVTGDLPSLVDCVQAKVRRWRFPEEVSATSTWSWTMRPKDSE